MGVGEKATRLTSAEQRALLYTSRRLTCCGSRATPMQEADRRRRQVVVKDTTQTSPESESIGGHREVGRFRTAGRMAAFPSVWHRAKVARNSYPEATAR